MAKIYKPYGDISIHALREEGDCMLWLTRRFGCNFYPRPPRGGRPTGTLGKAARDNFYPRPPRGGRLGLFAASTMQPHISIHALREEGDFAISVVIAAMNAISIHALREEGDSSTSGLCSSLPYFYPRPPRGGRQISLWL